MSKHLNKETKQNQTCSAKKKDNKKSNNIPVTN